MRLSRFGGVALAALIAAVPLSALAHDMEMWERSGGKAGMVDALVAAWNEANPDRKINLTYIPHTEMVPKLAQAIVAYRRAHGRFSSAEQLLDVEGIGPKKLAGFRHQVVW